MSLVLMRSLPGRSGLKATLNSIVSPGRTAPESLLKWNPEDSDPEAARVEKGGVTAGWGTQVKYTAAVPRCFRLNEANAVEDEGSIAGMWGEDEDVEGADVESWRCAWESSRWGPGWGPALVMASTSAKRRACSAANAARLSASLWFFTSCKS